MVLKCHQCDGTFYDCALLCVKLALLMCPSHHVSSLYSLYKIVISQLYKPSLNGRLWLNSLTMASFYKWFYYLLSKAMLPCSLFVLLPLCKLKLQKTTTTCLCVNRFVSDFSNNVSDQWVHLANVDSGIQTVSLISKSWESQTFDPRPSPPGFQGTDDVVYKQWEICNESPSGWGCKKKKKKKNRKMIVSWDKITGNCFQRVKALQDRVFFALRTAQVIVAKKMVWSRD